LLSSELVGDRSALDRFEREARAASALNHPNICTIYDVGEHEDQPYIVMELLEGETLADRIAKGALGTDEVLSVEIQVADALDAAHGADIIHRDIKPESVVVNSRGHAKVLDFGLARSRTESLTNAVGSAPETLLTQPHALMGTAPYMSPEQARGEDVDVRSDLFSFGAVFYEMGTGQRAFGGETASATFEAILFRNPTAPVRLNPALNGELETMILKPLEKNPDVRYQSAKDFFGGTFADFGAMPNSRLKPKDECRRFHRGRPGSPVSGSGSSLSTTRNPPETCCANTWLEPDR
jgi:serine/threonine protein kinase